MIQSLSETLKAMLTQQGVPAELAAAQISFDRPSEAFTPGQTTVNLFLYDIRENAELRLNEPQIDYKDGEAITRPPPRRVLCSYLVTAWPVGGTELALQEHRLLTQVLQALSRYPIIPADLAQGKIKTSDPAVSLQVAVGTAMTSASEFWSALGAKLRASLTVQATLALPLFDEPPLEPEPLVRTQKFVIGERQPFPDTGLEPGSAEEEEVLFLFGRVVRVEDQHAVPVGGAHVLVVEKDWRVTTREDGAFRFGPLPAGQYTLRIAVQGKTVEVHRDVPVPSGSYDIQVS